MPRYFIDLRYDGTAYHGWQIQNNSNTIQAVINKALSTLLKEDVTTTGAGRTDAGVHAEQLFCHFDCSNNIPQLDQFKFRLNSFLPNDVSITDIFAVRLDAHARFDATKRAYKYLISTDKNPFLLNKAWVYTYPLDLNLMNESCGILKSHKHFSCFSKSGVQVKTDICRIDDAIWTKREGMIEFDISADRFLRNMVRAIVGTMIEVGRKKMTLQEFENVIISEDRGEAGISVPAHGLYLNRIDYPENIRIDNV